MKNKEKIIYVTNDIWRIKALNFSEKLILSDMMNLINKGKVYNKHKQTVASDLGISTTKVENSFKKLRTLGFINTKKVLRKNEEGKITGCNLVKRKVNLDKIKAAKKFDISENNIFTKKFKDFSFTYLEIRSINKWINKCTKDRFLALHIIIKKNIFFMEHPEDMFCRFKKCDLYEVMGVSRTTGKKIYESLTRDIKYSNYEGETIGKGEIIKMYEKYEEEAEIYEEDIRELVINTGLLDDIGMMFEFSR